MIEIGSTTRYKYRDIFSDIHDTVVESCLQGSLGRLWVDDTENTGFAIAYEDGYCFLTGDTARAAVSPTLMDIHKLCGNGYLKVITDNPDFFRLIDELYGEKSVKLERGHLVFVRDAVDREKLRSLVKLPEGFSIEPMDAIWYERLINDSWGRDFVSKYSSAEEFVKRGLGKVIVKDGEATAAASSFSSYNYWDMKEEDFDNPAYEYDYRNHRLKGIEVEIKTRPAFEGNGLAKAAGAALIHECLERGLEIAWDAANPTSEHLATLYGYRFAGRYEVRELSK